MEVGASQSQREEAIFGRSDLQDMKKDVTIWEMWGVGMSKAAQTFALSSPISYSEDIWGGKRNARYREEKRLEPCRIIYRYSI